MSSLGDADQKIFHILGLKTLESLLKELGAHDTLVEGVYGVAGLARRCFRLPKELFQIEGATLMERSLGLFLLARETGAGERFTLNIATKTPHHAGIADLQARGVKIRALQEPDWVRSNTLQLFAILAGILNERGREAAAASVGAPFADVLARIEKDKALERVVLIFGCCDQWKQQPDFALNELRAILLARATGALISLQQVPGPGLLARLDELGATGVEVTHRAVGGGASFGPLRAMWEKKPTASAEAKARKLTLAVNPMILAGTPAAWLRLFSLRSVSVEILLRAAREAGGRAEAAARVFELARGTTEEALDFSRDFHSPSTRPPAVERIPQFALLNSVGWDDKGLLPQLRPTPRGVYSSGGEIHLAGCEAVTAIVSPEVENLTLHALGARELSVVVRQIAGRTHVFITGDSVSGDEIRQYQREQGL